MFLLLHHRWQWHPPSLWPVYSPDKLRRRLRQRDSASPRCPASPWSRDTTISDWFRPDWCRRTHGDGSGLGHRRRPSLSPDPPTFPPSCPPLSGHLLLHAVFLWRAFVWNLTEIWQQPHKPPFHGTLGPLENQDSWLWTHNDWIWLFQNQFPTFHCLFSFSCFSFLF